MKYLYEFLLLSYLYIRTIPVGTVYTPGFGSFQFRVKRSIYIEANPQNACSEINLRIIMEMHSIMEKNIHICIF